MTQRVIGWLSDSVSECEWMKEWTIFYFKERRIVFLQFLFISRKTTQTTFFYYMQKPNFWLLLLKQLVLLLSHIITEQISNTTIKKQKGWRTKLCRTVFFSLLTPAVRNLPIWLILVKRNIPWRIWRVEVWRLLFQIFPYLSKLVSHIWLTKRKN